jgi:hypothetical protein
MNTTRRRITGLGGSGTQNSGLAWAGYYPPSSPNFAQATEEYDGSSWSNGGNLINRNSKPGGAGTQNAAISMGGQTPSPGIDCITEMYDGSSWSTSTNIITARSTGGATGTQKPAFYLY